ncbi:Uncharacterized membrane protein YdjX, TVP38/TMEM64 family, SNARE-associated domain [Oceanobacillus limi]|uniref:TVP38/TMEM64 family membrane protein n=1 Tax=Oceanobacillus limi TaxID=930131 RepID=A0A1I0CGY8_9BACI|nr:TVP38/TMEM64 family protein [Oceanobacillus limi]SET18862.1 Uncharacterized membrane protein YdjX, TVP38/TMEM64 family, SNARE-associated domain [Oceanobacillus limi]
MIFRILFIGIIYGAILFTAYLYRTPIVDWLNQGGYDQLPFMFILAILFSTIPIVPFTIFAGIMGAKYGVWIGALINWTGSVGASIIFFILSRYFFVESFQRYIERYDKVQKVDQIVSQNAFIAILFTRMIPIIPTPIVNIYSGLSKMLFRHYFAATAIGQIPGMIVYAYLGNKLFTSLSAFFIGILIYIGFLLLIIPIYRLWKKSG